MKKIDFEFIAELTFEYELLHKNYGMVHSDEPFDLFYDGIITKLRTKTGGFPETIGMFSLNVLNIDMAKLFNVEDRLFESITTRAYQLDDSTYGINKLFNDPVLDLKEKTKIIFLKTAIIHPKYRDMGVFEELIKSIYMTHYGVNTFLIISGKPIQSVEEEYQFMSEITMDVWENDKSKINEKVEVNVSEYFKLNDLPNDDEINAYKLYAKFQSMNLTQYEDTGFFYYEQDIKFFEFLDSYSRKFKLIDE